MRASAESLGKVLTICVIKRALFLREASNYIPYSRKCPGVEFANHVVGGVKSALKRIRHGVDIKPGRRSVEPQYQTQRR